MANAFDGRLDRDLLEPVGFGGLRSTNCLRRTTKAVSSSCFAERFSSRRTFTC